MMTGVTVAFTMGTLSILPMANDKAMHDPGKDTGLSFLHQELLVVLKPSKDWDQEFFYTDFRAESLPPE